MVAAQPLETIQFRLATHYIHKLRQISLALQHNRADTNHWLQIIEQDWAQIKNWQQWTASHSQQNTQSARLCAEFGTDGHAYVAIRQDPAARLHWYRDALIAAQHAGDEARERQLLYDVGTTAYQSGVFDEAEQCSQRLLEIGAQIHDDLSLGYGWFITGNLHSHRSELDASEAAFRKAVHYFEACQAHIMTGHAVQGIARIMIFRGNYPEALIHASRYLSIIEKHGRESDFSLAYHTLSNIYTRVGKLAEAKDNAQKAVEISRRLGYVRMVPSNLLILGYAELALGELEEAWKHFQETLEGAHAALRTFDATAATYSLGDVRLRQNQYAEALHFYEQAHQMAADSGITAYLCLCQIQIAWIHATQNRIEWARPAMRQGAEYALKIGSDILFAKALIPAVKIWQADGETEPAIQWVALLEHYPGHGEPQLVAALRQELETQVGQQAFQTAYQTGQTISLKDAVTRIIADLTGAQDTQSEPPSNS